MMIHGPLDSLLHNDIGSMNMTLLVLIIRIWDADAVNVADAHVFGDHDDDDVDDDMNPLMLNHLNVITVIQKDFIPESDFFGN